MRLYFTYQELLSTANLQISISFARYRMVRKGLVRVPRVSRRIRQPGFSKIPIKYRRVIDTVVEERGYTGTCRYRPLMHFRHK